MKSFQKVQDVMRRDSKVIGDVMHCRFHPIVVDKAKGCVIKDLDGNGYLDFTSGGAVASTGYGHPDIVDAINTEARSRRRDRTTQTGGRTSSATCVTVILRVHPFTKS